MQQVSGDMLYQSTVAVFVFISVINGREVQPPKGIWQGTIPLEHEFPHHVYIGCDNRNKNGTIDWICNGAIINDFFVATTLSCLKGCIDLVIRLRSNLHPNAKAEHDYREVRNKNGTRPRSPPPVTELQPDLALIETEEINFVNGVAPVELPDFRTIAVGTELVATGFEIMPEYVFWNLNFLTLSVIDIPTCKDELPGWPLQYYHKCAQGINYNGDCLGSLCDEWGAPFVLKRDNKTLVGFYRRSVYGCEQGGPEVFVFIGTYVKWIKEEISKKQ